MHGQDGTSGVDWAKATEIGYALLLSPLFGFASRPSCCSWSLKLVVRNPALYSAPKGNTPPPWWIRGLLILTCTGVSFAHGSNDGQKGMGLIMLILIGTVPTAYALNRAMPDSADGASSGTTSTAAAEVVRQKAAGYNVIGDPRPGRHALCVAAQDQRGHLSVAGGAGAATSRRQVSEYGSLAKVPAEAVGNTRNDMYLASEAIRFLMKDKENDLSKDEVATLNAYKKSLDNATKFIPLWVKVAVAIALGLGTMVGWKRIVVTVGEKIGKSHLTYAQGASAELVAAATIGAADMLRPAGLDHACAVVRRCRHDGGQRLGPAVATVRNLLMAWVLTLPAAIMLSASLFVLFVNIFRVCGAAFASPVSIVPGCPSAPGQFFPGGCGDPARCGCRWRTPATRKRRDLADVPNKTINLRRGDVIDGRAVGPRACRC